MARAFNVLVPAPASVTVLSTDLTETEPVERRADGNSREFRGVHRNRARRHGRSADMEGSDGDPDLLDSWLDRSFIVTTASALFS